MDSALIHKLQNEDAEIGICGAILVNPDRVFDVSRIVTPADFYSPQYRTIYEAELALDKRNSDIDLVTLSNELKERGKLDEVGGLNCLIKIANETPSSLHATSYAEIVAGLAKRRRIFTQAHKLQKLAMDAGDLDYPIEFELGKIIDELAQSGQPSEQTFGIDFVVDEFMADLEDRKSGKIKPGLMTGFKKLDNLLGGLQPGQMVTIAGGPGTGKSMLAMQIAMQMSLTVPGALYSLEMPRQSVMRRMIASRGKIDTKNLLTGRLTQTEAVSIQDAADTIRGMKLSLSDSSNWNLTSLRADLIELKRKKNIKWFVFDYIYLLNDKIAEDEVSRSTYISRQLKKICTDLGLVGIIINSLNKEGMRATSPSLADLRGSGQAGYDLDIGLFLMGVDGLDEFKMLSEAQRQNMRALFLVKGRDIAMNDQAIVLCKGAIYPIFEEWQK
jgi:replicative DNA helicase